MRLLFQYMLDSCLLARYQTARNILQSAQTNSKCVYRYKYHTSIFDYEACISEEQFLCDGTGIRIQILPLLFVNCMMDYKPFFFIII